MSDVLVLGLLATVLTGTSGDLVNATVLAYSPVAQDITVGDQVLHVNPESPSRITVPLRVHAGTYTQTIPVRSSATNYALSVTVVGRRNWSWLWWLSAAPLVALGAAIRLKQTAAGNS